MNAHVIKYIPSIAIITLILFIASAPFFNYSMAATPPQPTKPANPFRNLPPNPDTSNPFQDSANSNPGNSDSSNFEYSPPSGGYEGSGEGGYNSGSDSDYAGGNPGSEDRSAGGASNSSLKPGDQLILGPKKPKNNARPQEVVENFDYPNAEILDVAKAISKLTGRNFIYNPQDVKGRISIVSETPIQVEDAWKAFLTALDIKGFTIIPSGQYSRIERNTLVKEKQTAIYAGKSMPDSDEYITRVLPLKYISAKDVENTFRLWVPRQGRMYAHEQTNTLIITDTASHIKSFIELIALLDISGFQESLSVIPIRFAAAKDLAKIIEQIVYGTKGGNNRFNPNVPRPPTFGGPPGSAGREGSSSISQIIADERTNSLIIKANKAGQDEIRTLVAKLDTKRAPAEGSGRIHVVRLQFADAEDVAKSLGAVVKDKGGSKTNAFPIPGSPSDGVASIFQGEIKVSPDTTTQSLVITAAPQDFQTLKRVIEQLDIPRDQVFVEAIIMELGMQNNDGFGVSFVNPRNGIFFPSKNLISLIQGSPGGGLSLGFRSGSTMDFQMGDKKISIASLTGLVELLQSTGNSNILARPHLIALDNQEAEFDITEEVPIGSTTTNVNNSQTFSFTKDKASMKLKVKPHINKASDYVRLEIEQMMEEFNTSNVPKESQGKAVGKSSRSTKTQAVVQNEDTVVISGMIREKKEEIINKVPLLGDIPVLGWLFKNSSVEKRKTDLVVFVTPRIVKQYDRMRTILSDRLQERSNFVKDNFGGDDPQSETVRTLKKRLPDLSKVQPLASPNTTKDSASFSAPTTSDDDNDGNTPNFNNYTPPPVEAPPVWMDPANPGVPGGDFGGGDGERF